MDVMSFPVDPELDLRAYVARLFERSRAEVPDVNVANLLHCAADSAGAPASNSGKQDASAEPSATAPPAIAKAPSGDASARGLPPRPPVPAFPSSEAPPMATSHKPPLPVGKGFGQRFASREGGPRPAPLGGVRDLQKQQAALMRMCAEASAVLQGPPVPSAAESGREGPGEEGSRQTLFIQDMGISPGALLQTPQAGSSCMVAPSPLSRGGPSGLTPPTPGAAGRGQELHTAAAGALSDHGASVGPAGQLVADANGLPAMTPRTELASIYSEMRGVIESGEDYTGLKESTGDAAVKAEVDGPLVMIEGDHEIMGGGFSDLDNGIITDVMNELLAEGMVNDGGASAAAPPDNTAAVKDEQEEAASEEPAAEGSAEDDDVMPADDGYSWRKYGQRQVRGREHPRCYYKCRHPGCPVRKQEERMAGTGEVVERVYRGLHNHPPPGRKAADVAAGHADTAGTEGQQEHAGPDGLRSQHEHGQNGAIGGKRGLEDEHGDEEETAAEKKRRLDIEAVGASEVVEQQRLVLELRSEVEILDDGYRWRKYGQKVVRGNLHPRSYYKCTHLDCGVRKQVERSVKDPMVVITTYEGRHNHEVPGGLLGAPQM